MSIYELLADQATLRPQATAMIAPDRHPLSYQELFAQIESTMAALNARGIGRNDRVALVLPDGPEMAVCFLAVSAAATSAPLNPRYRAEEFDFYLADLRARAVVTLDGHASDAIAAAKRRGLPILTLSPAATGPAGSFTLSGTTLLAPVSTGPTGPNDVALVLHTSGTTSRPKLVPLTQANLCHSAEHVRCTLALADTDRCLNVMPLFHIHGLIAGLLASLAAGATVVCTPGFDGPIFFQWLEKFRPTWYTAVPTMHQAVVSRGSAHARVIQEAPLRFIRSSSAALPVQVMSELERVFGAPVIEAYGMTEASHQVASNPLPPLPRRAGSVGLAAGPEVAIANERGEIVAPRQVGEIIIRGPNVTAGYEGDETVAAAAFTNGWFRTGDQGYLDVDGYLFITGRLKELINRAGEKIAPREVDEVLLRHPAVAQAVTFAVPDAQLGEAVAAAVVLREGTPATERQLRAFVADHLAFFKVPSHILLLPELPKGATGKLQRVGLAERLGIAARHESLPPATNEFVAARTPLEETLSVLACDVLGVDRVGVYQRLFDLGADSLSAARLIARIRDAFQVELSMLDFFDSPTVAGLATLVEQRVLDEIERMSDAVWRDTTISG